MYQIDYLRGYQVRLPDAFTMKASRPTGSASISFISSAALMRSRSHHDQKRRSTWSVTRRGLVFKICRQGAIFSPPLSFGSKNAEVLPRTGSCSRRTVVAADGNHLWWDRVDRTPAGSALGTHLWIQVKCNHLAGYFKLTRNLIANITWAFANWRS